MDDNERRFKDEYTGTFTVTPVWQWILSRQRYDPVCHAMAEACRYGEDPERILLEGFKAIYDARAELMEMVLACKTKHVDPIVIGDKTYEFRSGKRRT